MLILLLLLFLVYIPCFIHHILPAMRSDQADLIVTKHLWLDICEYELVTQIISEYTLLWNLTYRSIPVTRKTRQLKKEEPHDKIEVHLASYMRFP